MDFIISIPIARTTICFFLKGIVYSDITIFIYITVIISTTLNIYSCDQCETYLKWSNKNYTNNNDCRI